MKQMKVQVGSKTLQIYTSGDVDYPALMVDLVTEDGEQLPLVWVEETPNEFHIVVHKTCDDEPSHIIPVEL